MRAGSRALIERTKSTLPLRAWTRFLDARGLTLARGLAFQEVFAAFAGLWLAFAIGGFWIRDHEAARQALVRWIDAAIPKLVDSGGGGAIDLNELLRADVLGWSSAVAALVLLWTVISWFSALRESVRLVAGLPRRPGSFAIRRLWDALIALAFGLAVAVSIALTLLATTATEYLDRSIGISGASGWTHFATAAIGVVISVAIDVAIVAAILRYLAGTGASRRSTLEAAAIAAVAFAALKTATGLILRSTGSDPLLASFAIIIGLMLWFFLHCTILLAVAAWAAERDLRIRTSGTGGAPAA